jgi:hypothetical protein
MDIANPNIDETALGFLWSSRGHYWSNGVKMGWHRTSGFGGGLGWRPIGSFGWSGGGYVPKAYNPEFLP